MRYPNLHDWIREMKEYTGATDVHICDGSDAEVDMLVRKMLADGTLIELNQESHKQCYLARPLPTDVARAAHRTFVVGTEEEVGKVNNPITLHEARGKVWPLFQNSMVGKTMYVIPYAIGPAEGSQATEYGVEITDSPLLPVTLRTLYSVSVKVRRLIEAGMPYVRGLHAIADLDPNKLYVVHLPETDEIWSVNCALSGGNVVLPKKCHGLRLGSIHARNQGWLAEHMAILGVPQPDGSTFWVAAALPSACGKTTLATSGVITLGDDLAGLFIAPDGSGVRAVSRERGFYGVLKGTNMLSNPTVMRMLDRKVIYMGCAMTPDKKPWWTDCGSPLPPGSTAWDGRPIEQLGPDEKASHDNARFTVSSLQCESISDQLDNPDGVPIGAILFGNRNDHDPLVVRADDWAQGVYLGATIRSLSTAATVGQQGVLKYDRMAMRDFGAYNPSTYLGNWVGFGRRVPKNKLPLILKCNWFRRSDGKTYDWAGFEANKRVLNYAAALSRGEAKERRSIFGWVPADDAIDVSGLNMTREQVARLHHLDPRVALEVLEAHEAELQTYDDLPSVIWQRHEATKARALAALANG